MDIIAAIDRATGCHRCGAAALDNSPSDDFCSEECQAAWAAGRVALPTGYHEPHELDPGGVPEGFENYRRRWLLGFDGASDSPPVLHTAAAGRIYVADVDTQFEAIAGDDWREIGTTPSGMVFTNTTPTVAAPALLERMTAGTINAEAMRTHLAPIEAQFEALGRSLQPLAEMTFEAAQVNWDVIRRYYVDEPEQPSAPDAAADLRARALELRRNRNTGPTRQNRPPRAINPRSTR